MSAYSQLPTSPFHLRSETIRGFGVSASLLALLVLLFNISQPDLDIVRVRLAMVFPVEAQLIKHTVESFALPEGGTGSGAAGQAETNLPAVQPPQTMQLTIPRPVGPDELAYVDKQTPDWGQQGGSGPGNGDPGTKHQLGTPMGTGTSEVTPVEDEVLEFAEEDPQIDMEALRNAIEYPEIARRNGVQGTVIVKALIGKNGAVRSVHVYHSDNALLDRAAIDGVQNAVFTPGKQNGHAVSCWIYVPVKFTMKK